MEALGREGRGVNGHYRMIGVRGETLGDGVACPADTLFPLFLLHTAATLLAAGSHR